MNNCPLGLLLSLATIAGGCRSHHDSTADPNRADSRAGARFGEMRSRYVSVAHGSLRATYPVFEGSGSAAVNAWVKGTVDEFRCDSDSDSSQVEVTGHVDAAPLVSLSFSAVTNCGPTTGHYVGGAVFDAGGRRLVLREEVKSLPSFQGFIHEQAVAHSDGDCGAPDPTDSYYLAGGKMIIVGMYTLPLDDCAQSVNIDGLEGQSLLRAGSPLLLYLLKRSR